jgi:MoxR-like ATPase
MDSGVISDPKALMDEITSRIGEVILGKDIPVRLALACLLARGHLLIEDLPGVGKTTLAHALASTLGLQFSRIQFTSDLLPADILGVSIYEQAKGSFAFHPGPIFAQLVLADEVNRATPKTQSALLEAMEERQVTVEGETRNLPEPFFVIATQNPTYQIGTFPLPESQLDRFLMRIHLGYPDKQAERALLAGQDRRRMLPTITPLLNPQQLAQLQNQVEKIHASAALLDYVQALLNQSRQSAEFAMGLSPRAGLALLRAARAWALIAGRDHLLPDDIQMVLPSVVNHRLRSATDSKTGSAENLSRLLLEVPIP